MSVNFADLCVLGDDLSGIAAGSLLAKRGLNVLLVDRPTSARPLSLAGLQSRIFKSLISKMGIAEKRARPLRKNKVSFQVILPGHRIDITPDNEHLLQEFEREFPAQVGWAKELLEEVEETYNYEANPLLHMIPWVTWRERRRFLKAKNQYGWPQWTEELKRLPQALQVLFKAWILFLTNNPTSFADSLQPFSLLTEEARSTVTIKGGWRELKRLFLEKIEYYGGTVLPEPPPDYALETESTRIKGVSLDGYHFTTHCRYLLVNEPIANFVTHIPRNFRTKRYHRSLTRAPSSYECCIHFVTSAAVLPEPMCQDMVVVSDIDKPLFDSNYFRVQISRLAEPRNESEDTLLQVSYYLPAMEELDESAASLERFEARHEAIESSLRQLIPFSHGKLRRTFPIAGAVQNDLFDDPNQDYAQFVQQAQQEQRFPPSFSFPGLKTPYENLFTVGPDQMGWLGLPGRLQGGLKAVDCIWAKEAKLRSP